MSKPQAIIASLFTYGVLIYVAYLIGKSLQPFISVGIVLIVLAINVFARSKRKPSHRDESCGRSR